MCSEYEPVVYCVEGGSGCTVVVCVITCLQLD